MKTNHRGRREDGRTRERENGIYLRHSSWVTRLAVTLLAAWMAGFVDRVLAAEMRTTLTVQTNGSCTVRSDTTQLRLTIEQQVKMWERYQRQSDEIESDDAKPKSADPEKEKASKPLTDEELARKIREQSEGSSWLSHFGGEAKIESVDVKSNTVRTVVNVAYATLEEFLRHSGSFWGQSGLSFENLRFEKDTNSNLRVTMTPHPGYARLAKNVRQNWKMTGMSVEFRFVFPGKVLSSGLPSTEGNATWIAFDGKKEETLGPALKLLEAPTIITAELGGLLLDAPLESKVLQRQAGRPDGGDSALPITDAGPGFTAEALNVTMTTVHYFAEGQKYRKQAESALGHQPTGAVVQAKLFAPKGRTLQSVSGVRVLKAVDDKGRPISTGTADEGMSVSTFYSGGRQGPGSSTQIELRLPLPASDAQSIEQLDGEAIATTTGSWRELKVPNVSASTTNEIDLSSVLGGSKMVFRKVTRKKSQTTIEGEIKGSPSIRQIELTTRVGNSGDPNERSTAHVSDLGFTTKDNVSTRKFHLQAYSYSEEGEEDSTGPLSVVVRFPEDQKRERVKFTLKGLDLF